MGKVFCGRCKHHRQGIVTDRCNHPSNFVDTWYGEKDHYKSYCSNINRNNECENFEEKKKRRFWII